MKSIFGKLLLLILIFALVLPSAVSGANNEDAHSAEVVEESSLEEYEIASWRSYVGYRLPRNKGTNYTSFHVKETNDQHSINVIENLEHTNVVETWINKNVTFGSRNITDRYDQRQGNSTRLEYNISATSGDQVRLGIRNGERRMSYAFAAGRVNFR